MYNFDNSDDIVCDYFTSVPTLQELDLLSLEPIPPSPESQEQNLSTPETSPIKHTGNIPKRKRPYNATPPPKKRKTHDNYSRETNSEEININVEVTVQTKEQELIHFEDEINNIYINQQNLQIPISFDYYELYYKQQLEIQELCVKNKDILDNILLNSIVQPCFLDRIQNLINEYSIIEEKIKLYKKELEYSYFNPNITDDTRDSFYKLLITKQPFPKAIKKDAILINKNSSDNLIVSLISAPKTSNIESGVVKATISFNDYNTTQENYSIKMKSFEEKLTDGNAVFSNLRFISGSKQKLVRLQFSIEIQSQVITSNYSNLFIIMSNENQWKYSEGLLLKTRLYSGDKTISKEKFSNILHEWYLHATRQSFYCPSRIISLREFDYLYNLQYFNSLPTYNDIPICKFEQFWDWFGDILYKLRFRKLISSLWLTGDIIGFVNRYDTEFLQNYDIGTFLIRVCESNSGFFVISYCDSNDNTTKHIKHYLIKEYELNNLIEFLHSKQVKLKKYLKLKIQNNNKVISYEIELSDITTLINNNTDKIPQLERDGYENDI